MTRNHASNREKTYNHLKEEKSPYLVQHAGQPVDWYPWGSQAFEKARQEDKPVLVSVGYSTCHWCHVMAEESFEDERIADLMNRSLVPVKVDREERPDIDSFLITAVQALTGSAGWPLNVFLTPDGQPFFGGTYFPPHARQGMPGWSDVVSQVAKAWNDPEQREKIKKSADSITQQLKAHLSRAAASDKAGTITNETLRKAVDAFAADFDQKNGGFGAAPKFPMPSILSFLSAFYRLTGERLPADTDDDEAARTKALQMLSGSLDAMAAGGIYDHIGGGFHRYATDERWHVPHFEKMLYDNAQLVSVYVDAYELTGEEAYARVARETIDYVLRDMTHPEGGLFSAEDADSLPPGSDPGGWAHGRKREGAFYVWQHREIEEILSDHPDDEAAAIFSFVYDIRGNGNVANDPFGEFKQQNVLYKARSVEAAAARFKRPAERIREIVDNARELLFKARLERFRPHLDDKILTAWNGLMISALARALQAFNRPTDLEAARRAATFLHRRLYDADSQTLHRRWREGEARIEGMADDYAYLIQGLLDLYEADFDPWHLKWAVALTEQFKDRFVDAGSGTVYMTPQGSDPYLALTMQDGMDNVTPAAASVAALNLVRLSRMTGTPDFETAAQRIIEAGGKQLSRSPKMAPYLLKAVMLSQSRHIHLLIAGSIENEETRLMIETGRQSGGFGSSIVRIKDRADREALSAIIPGAAEMAIPEFGASAQLCLDQACRPPVETSEKLARLLETATN